MMVCGECGARFEKALFLQTGDTSRVVCPVCKARGPTIECAELEKGMSVKFEIKDD